MSDDLTHWRERAEALEMEHRAALKLLLEAQLFIRIPDHALFCIGGDKGPCNCGREQAQRITNEIRKLV